MKPQAFIDNGYSKREDFLEAFLSSPDFHQTTLIKILNDSQRLNKKNSPQKLLVSLIQEKLLSQISFVLT